MITTSKDRRNFIQHIASQAGRVSLEYRAKLSEIRIDRKSMKDLVTEADRAVEGYLIDQIKNAYPDHGIRAEESGFHAGTEFTWIIDPIDGTTSFVHGHPSYCISIALQKNGQTVLGVVYAPVSSELYMAELHQGAELNGEPIHVSSQRKLSDCLFNTGFACLRSDWKHNNLSYLNNIAPHVRGIRMSGSAALDLAFVACGRSEGYWELNLNHYDIAAGMLLVSEAGGKVTDFKGGHQVLPAEVLASNGVVHDEILALLSGSTISISA